MAVHHVLASRSRSTDGKRPAHAVHAFRRNKPRESQRPEGWHQHQHEQKARGKAMHRPEIWGNSRQLPLCPLL